MISHQMMVFPAQSAYEVNGEWEVHWFDGYEIYPFDMEETEENILEVLRNHEQLRDVKIDDTFSSEGAYDIVDEHTGEPYFRRYTKFRISQGREFFTPVKLPVHSISCYNACVSFRHIRLNALDTGGKI